MRVLRVGTWLRAGAQVASATPSFIQKLGNPIGGRPSSTNNDRGIEDDAMAMASGHRRRPLATYSIGQSASWLDRPD